MLTRRRFIARASAAIAGALAVVAGVPWGGSERWGDAACPTFTLEISYSDGTIETFHGCSFVGSSVDEHSSDALTITQVWPKYGG